jgi:transcriptional regulator with XRE-family HTH domain
MTILEQMNYIVKTIRKTRLKKGISQMELSLRSGLAQGFITDIELGKKQPSVMTILRIAQALEVNPADFFPLPQVLDGREKARDTIKARIAELLNYL